MPKLRYMIQNYGGLFPYIKHCSFQQKIQLAIQYL